MTATPAAAEAWDDDLGETLLEYGRRHVPPSAYVKKLDAEGRHDEAWSRWWDEIIAATMGITIVELQRRYPSERRQTMDQRRVVYFISASATPPMGEPVKIGIATNAHKRLAAIQVHHPQKLHLLGVVKDGVPLERELHKRFADQRLNGEWFAMSDDLGAYIKENAS